MSDSTGASGASSRSDPSRVDPSRVDSHASSACDLCGLPVLGRPIHDHDHDFCCEGCRRVYVTAEEAGITELLVPGQSRRSRGSAAGARKAAAAAAAGARRETLRIDGMWCTSCGLVLEDGLMALPGVLDAETSYAASLLRVTWDPTVIALDAITDRIELLGYHAVPAREAATRRADVDDLFLRLFVSLAVGMWVMWPTWFVSWPAFARGEYASVATYDTFTGALSLVVLVYCGWPFIMGAWRAARVQRATMDTLVVLGTFSAWLYSAWAVWTASGPTYFESAAGVVTIVLAGRWIEALSTRDATASLAALASGAEESAWLAEAPDVGGGSANESFDRAAIDAGAAPDMLSASRVAVADLPPDALVLIRPGERVPADGIVLVGEGEIDRSRLTGESMPAAVGVGDEVWAGTVNLSAVLRVRVTRAGAETLAGRLASLAEDAAFAKSHTQRITDAVAAVFTPVVIAFAAATLLIGLVTGVGLAGAVERAVAVLVVSCPCALGLATPVALSAAISAGSKHGLLFRGGPALETAGEIAVVAFDKTGTLTLGMPSVTGFLPPTLTSEESARLLSLAAAIEVGDAHPVAAAIVSAAMVAAAGAEGTAADAVERHPGRGLSGVVSGRRVLVGSERLLAEEGVALDPALASTAEVARRDGELVVWVAADGEVLGGVRLADRPRPEAASAVAALTARGVATAMVSGDALATCESVAARLGVTRVLADVLPHEKERVVRELAEEGTIAFVGDGINDAAALAASDLAVAVGAGSDVAVLAADVVLTRDTTPLTSLAALLDIAKASRHIIGQNLAWAFTYNVVAIPLAATGRLSPIAAALAMAGSSLAVIGNSLRIHRAAKQDTSRRDRSDRNG